MFKGEHCETTAIGVLMKYLGFDYSEAMLFGLGEGLNYGILPWGREGFPFLGGRSKQGEILDCLCDNLGLKLTENRTTSKKKAWQTVKEYLDQGRPVGLQLDCYHLEYFTSKVHFAGHFAAIVGYDEKEAHMIDTQQQGGHNATSLDSLELARSEKGPMYGKNLSFVIDRSTEEKVLEDAIKVAIKSNAYKFLNPPITNFGHKGLIRTSKEIKKWYKVSTDIEEEFRFASIMMEKGGTGGAMFRNLYRDFLHEAMAIIDDEVLKEAHELFSESSRLWSKVSDTLMAISRTKSYDLVDEVSDLFVQIEYIESKAMRVLLTLK